MIILKIAGIKSLIGWYLCNENNWWGSYLGEPSGGQTLKTLIIQFFSAYLYRLKNYPYLCLIINL